jgi:hypothetical protein
MIPPMTKNPAKKINHQELPVNFKDVLKHHEYLYDYPLVILHSYWKWPIEIVDLPSYKMVIFHSYVSLPDGMTQL